MMKLNVKIIFSVWLNVSLLMGVSCFAQGKQKLPNVVFILADDLGYGDLTSFNPDAQVATPNISKLAAAGMRFTDAHSPSSVCTPTRYGILTGRYSFRTYLKKGTLVGYSSALLEGNRFTIGNLAKGAGYQTAIIGKWHLGLDWKPLDSSKKAIQQSAGKVDLTNIDFQAPVLNGPNHHGFDYSYILPASLDMSPYLYLENGKLTDYPLVLVEDYNAGRGIFWRVGYKGKNFRFENKLDDFTAQAETYIRKAGKEKSTPFFMCLMLTAPHTPWLPAQPFKRTSGAGVYGDFVAHTDNAVGRILTLLDSLKLTENTLVVFSSDNGADWKNPTWKRFLNTRPTLLFAAKNLTSGKAGIMFRS